MNRKRIILIILTALVLGMALFNGGCESGTGMLVEIFYLPHAPAEAVVKDVESILQKHKAFSIKKYSFDDPENRELINGYDLGEHTPVAIIINGKNEFSVGDRHIALKNFPKGSNFVPMFEGEWGYQDLENILKSLTGDG